MALQILFWYKGRSHQCSPVGKLQISKFGLSPDDCSICGAIAYLLKQRQDRRDSLKLEAGESGLGRRS